MDTGMDTGKDMDVNDIRTYGCRMVTAMCIVNIHTGHTAWCE